MTGSPGSGWGTPLTIAQDSTRLTVEYSFFSRYDLQPPLQFTYALDGRPVFVHGLSNRDPLTGKVRLAGEAGTYRAWQGVITPAAGAWIRVAI